MKNKSFTILTAGTVVVIAAICTMVVLLMSGKISTYYYTQIDNTKIEQGHGRNGVIDLDGGMDYYYTLPSYDEKAKAKDIKFGTSKQLKEGAFIRIAVVPIRGTITWMEIKYDDLPEKVKIKYTKPVELK